ncbi:MAG TPA: beta-ketoacyl-ACP synthase II [Candidatus Brocadiia bacterium]|nr:beta-ketoacyl-ACP synthase II [Candidatus Brocadiia bacterium]
MKRRRVAITGVGVACPLGAEKSEFLAALAQGRSGVAPIRSFPAEDLEVRIAAEISGFPPEGFFNAKELRRMDRFTLLAAYCAEKAVADSRLDLDALDPVRAAVMMGTGIGGLEEIISQHDALLQKGPGRVSPLTVPRAMSGAAASLVSMRLGLHGPAFSVSSACTSGANAILSAAWQVRHGMSDVVLAGGTEATLNRLTLSGFINMKALSRRNDNPSGACRPFDQDRDGFVMGEGAGVIVLEEMDRAKARGAEIYAEVLGGAMTSDAFNVCLPDPDGRWAARAMRDAMADAEVATERISYINAHGTGTKAGDEIEAKAIRDVFGDHASGIPVSSTKSMLGHLLGASGAVEIVACLLSMRNNLIHRTLNLENPDPACLGLDFVAEGTREAGLDCVLKNSFGFGGHNVALVLGRV